MYPVKVTLPDLNKIKSYGWSIHFYEIQGFTCDEALVDLDSCWDQQGNQAALINSFNSYNLPNRLSVNLQDFSLTYLFMATFILQTGEV